MVGVDKVDDGWPVGINMAATEQRSGYGYSALHIAVGYHRAGHFATGNQGE